VTVPRARQSDLQEAAAVFRIDLRASATGPDAADAGSIDSDTLEALQRRGPGSSGSNGHVTGGWRIVDIERLLVVDDAARFSRHADAYQHLVEAPTFGRMLCLVLGPPPDPPFLDLPQAVDSVRAPVLWVGDPRGVGWRMGRSSTTRLAFNEADADGAMTVADLIDSLTSHEVFDQMAKAIDGLPGRTAVPALLPWVRWPVDDQTGDGKQEDATTAAVTDATNARHDAPAARSRGAGSRVTRSRVALPLLLALGCALAAVAALLAVPLGRLGVGYLAADVGFAVAGLLVLLVIAFRVRRDVPALAHHAAFAAPPAPPGPAEPLEPHGTTAKEPPHGQVPEDILAHTRWIMSATADDESFRQLSSPDQLVMLGGEPPLARLVKFAPATARHLIESAAAGHFVAWTTVGDRVGVIRLVPIKAGLVRLS
jgi:hypothetical protein